jgi:hypothetical protein
MSLDLKIYGKHRKERKFAFRVIIEGYEIYSRGFVYAINI